MAETETETEGLSAARLAEIEAHVARRHAAGAFHGHTDGQWWSVLDEYQRDTTALVAEVRRLRAALEGIAGGACCLTPGCCLDNPLCDARLAAAALAGRA